MICATLLYWDRLFPFIYDVTNPVITRNTTQENYMQDIELPLLLPQGNSSPSRMYNHETPKPPECIPPRA
jgi:hypothetical protein